MAETENTQQNQVPPTQPVSSPDVNTGNPSQPAGQPVAFQATEQAQKTAEQMAGGVMQGVEKLKQTGVAGVFKKAENQPPVTMDEKLWAGISYIPLVALAALVVKPDSGFIKLHGRQGLLIFLVFFICIFVYLVPFIGPLFGGLIQFALFILGIFSMYQAFIGNWWKIPVVGDLADVIPLSLFEKVTKEVITGQPAAQEPQQPTESVGNVPTQQPEPPKEQPPAAT